MWVVAAYLFVAKFVEWKFEDTGEFAFVLLGLGLGGKKCYDICFAKMILNLSPLAGHLNEWLTSLRFATNAITIYFSRSF